MLLWRSRDTPPDCTMHTLLKAALSGLALVCCNVLAAPAARVDFVFGQAVAIDLQGRERRLTKGAEVGGGDTVDTRNARVQLRFSDGAQVSLQPRTKFRIDQYRYDGKIDGSERGEFSLIEGGMRTITGVVGRTNKRNYRVSTAVATIGIRGTEYTASFDGGMRGSVGEGEIDVCNAGGCTNVRHGEAYFVADASVRPAISAKKTDLPPPQETSTQPADPVFTQADTCIGITCGGGGTPFTGAQQLALAHAVNVSSGSAFGVIPLDGVAFDAGGNIASVNNGNDPLVPVLSLSDGKFPPVFGNDGRIAWGVAKDKFGQFFHYVTGTPGLASEVPSLQMNTPVAHFELLGASRPIALTSAAQHLEGRVTSGALVARFLDGKLDAKLTMEIGGATFTARGNDLNLTTASGTLIFGAGPVSCTIAACSGISTPVVMCEGTACSGDMQGFIGAGGARAGLAYSLAVPNIGATGPVKGTAAFTAGP